MDLNDYLRQLDELTENASSDYLKTILKDCVSRLSIEDRIAFLNEVETIIHNDLDVSNQQNQYEQRVYLMTDELLKLRLFKPRIYGEIDFEPDGSVDEDHMYYYIDYGGLCEKIEEAFQLIIECYEFGLCQYAYMVSEEVNELLKNIYAVYEDGLFEKPFWINDFLKHDLLRLPMPLEDLIVLMCACAYNTVAKKDRTKAIYEILVQYKIIPVSFECVLEKANVEMKESQVFLKEWIAYLMQQKHLINRKAAKSSFALIEDEAYCCSTEEQFERKYSKTNRKYTNR